MRIKKIRKVTAIKITALMAVTQTHSKLSLVKVHMKQGRIANKSCVVDIKKRSCLSRLQLKKTE
jgi:hypothetical protein